jgi:hypothetical protein
MNLDLTFYSFLKEQEIRRLEIYKNLAYVYEFNIEEIERILKKTFLNKPFSEDTLNKIVFYHRNIIKKILKRKTAGMFSRELIVKLKNGKEELSINDFLNETKFFMKLIELYRASKYFNTMLFYVNVVEGELIFELLNGSECIVNNKNNYLKIKDIQIFRADEQKQVYIQYWDENEVYKLYGSEKKYLEAFPSGINKLKMIPIAVYRDEEYSYFWGEPNWQLYFAQLFYTMRKSDSIRGEFYQKFPFLFGKNIPLEKLKVTPSEAVLVEQRPDFESDIRFVSPAIDWAQLRENEKFDIDDLIISEGLPASSTSIEAITQSGYAKTIDEVELRESIELDEWKIYYFIKDVIPIIIKVANYFNILPDDIKKFYNDNTMIETYFAKAKTYETPSDKKQRYDFEKENLISDEVDIIMNELGLTEEQAIDYLEKRLKRSDLINEIRQKLSETNSEVDTSENESGLIQRLKQLIVK